MGLMQKLRGGAKVPDVVTVDRDPLGTAFERRSTPEQMRKIRAANRDAALSWADAVRAGTMTRAQFDMVTRQAVRMRMLLPEDHATAAAKLDG
jgi:hypothetical protein